MAKKQELAKQAPVQTLNKEHIQKFKMLSNSKTMIEQDKAALNDDIKAIAEQLGWTVGKVNSILNTMMKEQEKGGVLKAQEEIHEAVKQILNIDDLLTGETSETK